MDTLQQQHFLKRGFETREGGDHLSRERDGRNESHDERNQTRELQVDLTKPRNERGRKLNASRTTRHRTRSDVSQGEVRKIEPPDSEAPTRMALKSSAHFM